MKPFYEEIFDRTVRRGIALEKYKNHEVQRIVAFFNKHVEPDLVKQVMKYPADSWTGKRVRAMKTACAEIVRDGYTAMRDDLAKDLTDFGKQEIASQAKLLQQSSPVEFAWVRPNVNIVATMIKTKPINGVLLRETFEKMAADTAYKVNKQIVIGYTEGEGVDKIVRRIKGTYKAKYTDGILNRPRHEIAAMVRTSIAGVSDGVRREMYEANRHIIKQVRYIATLDTRTCEVCGGYDGKVYDVGKQPYLPIHWGCRCTTVPITKTWKELGIDGAKEAPTGTRAANPFTKDELKRLRKLPKEDREKLVKELRTPVKADTTYATWLKSQSVAAQNEALGIRKAQAFRAGKVKFTQFVNNQRHILTLKELGLK